MQQNGAGPATRGTEDEDDVINIGELIGTLLAYKWLIVGLTALAVAIGVVVAYAMTPIYRADALLQVDEQGSNGISVLKELEPLVGDSTSVAAELEILNSRMVLGRAVEKLGLDIVARPQYAPLIGAAAARRFGGNGLREPMFGMAQYAWGGEQIRLTQMDVEPGRRDSALTLVAGEGNTYRVLEDDGAELLRGIVGQPASAPGLTLTVAQLQARPGAQFDIVRLSPEAAVNSLRARYSVRERGRKSGIIEASLTGPDRAQLPLVLNEIASIYYRQNLEKHATEAENQLKFLETQLPTLKAQLDAAEIAYNSYRQSRGSVDLDLETQGVLRSLIEVETEVAKLRQEREEMRQLFTPNHPRVQALDAKLRILSERKVGFDRGVNRLPETQQTAIRLRRDVEVSTTLYIGLLSTAQQLRVSKAGTVGDVRIIDTASVSRLPVEPRKTIVLAVALLLGLTSSMVVVWLTRSLHVVVEDPDTIERKLGLSVLASIPHSKAEKIIGQKENKGSLNLLASAQPDDDAIESLRSLRTTLHFAMQNATRRSILITGPSQSIGKSFISKNLGAVVAQSGRRVVVVDADLRRGHIHKEFGFVRDGGVSEYVAGEINLTAAVKSTGIENLSVVSTGRLPINPSEMLLHPRFEQLLKQLEDAFDLLIVDAPPILAVADAGIVGRFTGATLLLARAGRHPIQELQQAHKRLIQAGIQVTGVVLNDLDTDRQKYRYGYEGYVYKYRYQKSTDD